MSLLPIMRRQALLARAARLDLETFFTPDTTEDPEDPPLNYQGVRTDRYLYAQYGTGEQELYDLRSDPFELQNAAPIPPTPAVKSSLQRLLGGLANCAGQRLPRSARGEAEGSRTARRRWWPAVDSPRRRPSTCAARRSGGTRSLRSARTCPRVLGLGSRPSPPRSRANGRPEDELRGC